MGVILRGKPGEAVALAHLGVLLLQDLNDMIADLSVIFAKLYFSPVGFHSELVLFVDVWSTN